MTIHAMVETRDNPPDAHVLVVSLLGASRLAAPSRPRCAPQRCFLVPGHLAAMGSDPLPAEYAASINFASEAGSPPFAPMSPVPIHTDLDLCGENARETSGAPHQCALRVRFEHRSLCAPSLAWSTTPHLIVPQRLRATPMMSHLWTWWLLSWRRRTQGKKTILLTWSTPLPGTSRRTDIT